MELKKKIPLTVLGGLAAIILGAEAILFGFYLNNKPKEQKVVPKTDYVTQLPIPHDKIKEISTADMNGDGRQDIIILGGENSSSLTNVYVLLNEGNGNYKLQEKIALDKLIGGMDGGK